MLINNPNPAALFCPYCGESEEPGWEEVDGYFSPFTHILKCPECGALVEEGHFLTRAEARAIFRD